MAAAPASGCVNNARSIQLARKLVAIALLPLFSLPFLLWKLVKVPENLLWALQNIIGWEGWPPAVYNSHRLEIKLSALNKWPVGTECCRSAETSCRRQFWQQQRTDSVWHEIPSKCVHQHIPYHAFDLKGYVPWFSDHQLHISMRDGLRNQVCALASNVMQTKQTHKAHPQSHDQEARHACQCNAT